MEVPFPRRRDWRPLIRPHALARPGRFANFAIIGIACTAAFAVLYNLSRLAMPPLAANVAALSLTMVANFATNRRFTFDAGHGPLARQAWQYGLVYGAGLAGSTVALHLALAAFPHPGSALETALAVAAGGVATVTRFVLLSAWVFRRPAPGVSV